MGLMVELSHSSQKTISETDWGMQRPQIWWTKALISNGAHVTRKTTTRIASDRALRLSRDRIVRALDALLHSPAPVESSAKLST